MNQTNVPNVQINNHTGEIPREDLMGVTIGAQPFVPLVKTPPPPRKWFWLKKKLYKTALIAFTVIFVPFLLYLVLFFTNADTQIVQPTITLRFLDAEVKTPIEGIDVLINGQNAGKTDQNGRITYATTFGENRIQTSSEDYKNYDNTINFSKKLFNYSYSEDIFLETSLTGKIIGSFKGAPTNYKFFEDSLTLGDQRIAVKDDGTFIFEKSKVGNQKLIYRSVNFQDVEINIDVKPEDNTIPAITLIAAGDIIGNLESWVRGDFVLSTNFEIENILSNQIEIESEGSFRIRDLEVGRSYKIRTTADGYNQRDYEIKIGQGNNELFGFRMVEEGKTTFWQDVTSENAQALYIADYDGANAKEILRKGFSNNIKYDYYDVLSNKVFFHSDKDRVDAENGNAKIIYSVDASTGEEVRITQSNANFFENVYPNYIAGKTAVIYQFRQGSTNETRLIVTDLSGDNLVEIKNTSTENLADLKISDNGKYLFYKLSSKNSSSNTLPTLYRFDLTTKEERSFAQKKEPTIIDVSSDGNRVVFTSVNETTNFRDSIMYDFQNNETRTIYENIDTKNSQFLNSDNDKILYYATREGRNNIYTYSISENKTDRITNLPVTDKIENLYQQHNLTYYITDKGLFVIDILKPKNLSKVTEDISSYEGPIN